MKQDKLQSTPDPATISLVTSIKMNPNFVKLLTFSLNCLQSQIYLPNNKHRSNAVYLYQQCYDTLLQILELHKESDALVSLTSIIINRMVGLYKFRDERYAKYTIESGLTLTITKILNRQLPNDAIKNILDLYTNLTLSQQQNDNLAVLLPSIIHMVTQCKPNHGEIRKAFDLVYKLLVQNVILSSVDCCALTKEILFCIVEYVENNYVIKECLKFLLVLVRDARCLQIIQQQQLIPVQSLTSILIQHSNSEINEKGAKILEKIITPEEIEKCMASVKSLDMQAEYSMSLLACLVPVIHDSVDLVSLILDVIKNKKILKRKPLVRDALAMAVYLIDQDSAYIQKLSGALQPCIDLFECDDPEVVGAAFDLVRKIAGQSPELQTKLIEKILAAMQTLKGVKQGLRLLLTLSTDEKLLKPISKGKELLIKVAESLNDEQINEYNAKLMLAVINEAKDYFTKKQLAILAAFHRSTGSNAYLYLKILNQLNDHQQIKKTGLLIIVSVLYGKNYTALLKVQKDSDDEEEDEEEYQVSQVSQDLILEQGRELLTKIVKQEDIKLLQKEVLEENQKNQLNFEIAIIKLAYAILVDPAYYMRLNYYLAFKEHIFTALKQQSDCKDIQLAILKFLEHMCQQYKDPLFQQMKIAELSFELLFLLLDEESIIENTLDALINIGNQMGPDVIRLEGETYILQLISIIQIYMKKYQNQENIQLKLLQVIKIYLLNDLFKKNIRDIPRLLCRKLPDQGTTKAYGLQTIDILQQLSFSENALKPSVQFQLEHQHERQVLDVVSNFIGTMPQAETDQFFSQELKDKIIMMIRYLETLEDPLLGAQYLDQLSVYSLVENIFAFELENGILQQLEIVLQYTLQDVNSDGLVCSALNILLRAKTNTIEPNVIVNNLKAKRHSFNPVSALISYLFNLTDFFIVLEDIDLFLELLEEFQDPQLISNIQAILFRSCKSNTYVRERIANPRFIQRLMREIRENLIEELPIVDQLKWIVNLVESVECAKIIVQDIEVVHFLMRKQYISEALTIYLYLIQFRLFHLPIRSLIELLSQQTVPVLNILEVSFPQQSSEFILPFQDEVLKYESTYPDQILRIFNNVEDPAKRETVIRKSIVEKPTIQSPVKQEVIQQEEKFVDQCLRKVKENPIGVLEEGLLEELFETGNTSEAWEVFRQLAHNYQAAQQILRPNQKLYQETLIQLNDPNSKQAAFVLGTAGCISQVSESLEEFSKGNGTQLMVKMIEQQQDDPDVVCAGLEALGKLCKDESIIYQLGNNEILALQAAIMNKHQGNQKVIQFVDDLILLLNVSEDFQDQVAEKGILQQLILQIEQNIDNAEIVEPAVYTLAQLVYKHHRNSQIVMDSNLMQTLIQTQLSMAVDKAIALLINNLAYKNQTVKEQFNVDYLVKLFQKHLNPMNPPLLNECLKALFGMASIQKNVQKMIKFQMVDSIILLSQKCTELPIVLSGLNLLLKMMNIFPFQVDGQLISALLECLIHDKLEMPALRILRLIFKPELVEHFSKGQVRIMSVIKRQDLAASLQSLDLILSICKISGIQEYEKLNIDIELSDLLRVYAHDVKLFEQIIEVTQLLKVKSILLMDQILVFYQQNQLNEVQIIKVLELLQQAPDSPTYIQPLITLLVNYPKLTSIILCKQSEQCANSIFVNKGVELSVKLLDKTQDYNSNLIKIISDVAHSMEEYRQQISDSHLAYLIGRQDDSLADLIAYLQLPKKPISNVPDEVYHYLQKGEVFKIYKEDGNRSYYRLHLTEDRLQFRCKKDSDKAYKQKWIINVTDIESIKSDYNARTILESPFHNQNWFVKQIHKMKNKVIEPGRCFTLNLGKGSKLKSWNCLCKTQGLKDKFVSNIQQIL